jgi:hypothetical protein
MLELEELLRLIAARLRLRRAMRSILIPAAALLAAALAAVIAVKLAGPAGAATASLLVTGVVLAGLGAVLAATYALRPVSRLHAACELDRLAGLKERVASLVAVRAGQGGASDLRAALEAEAGRALAAVNAAQVLARCPPLPGGSRWLAVLLAATLAGLLLPARQRGRTQRLADMVTDGAALLGSLSSAAEGGDGGTPPLESARMALVLVKAPPPRDAREFEKRRVQLGDLAAELRRRGAREAAARLLAACGELETGLATGDGPEPETAGRQPPAGSHERYPPAYRELLARYFAGSE